MSNQKDKNTKNHQLDDLLKDMELNSEALKEAVEKSDDESVEILKKMLEETQVNIRRALDILSANKIDTSKLHTRVSSRSSPIISADDAEKVLEGVFNGESMVGSDGKEYSIPPNYASKSKLVEGDILKLTITKNGSFIYKQIGPIERDKCKAVLLQDEITGDWYAVSDSRRWKLLTASVTYFKGQPGDEVVILIPKNSKSLWASVENIIKQ